MSKNSGYFFEFEKPLVKGRILKRYQRFLADIELDDGKLITAHVANSGRMTTCWEPGAEVVVTELEKNHKRKLNHRLQAVKMADGWVSVNTMNPNKAILEAVLANHIVALRGYELCQSEVKVKNGSRFDLALYNKNTEPSDDIKLNPGRARVILPGHQSKTPLRTALVEIKNATLLDAGGVRFPDAVTERGQKHLIHLMELAADGWRTLILYFVGRTSASWAGPADKVDPEYGRLLRRAVNNGVEAIAISVEVTQVGLSLKQQLPVVL